METAIFPRKFSGELAEFIKKKNAEAPFKFWLEKKLKRGDILPRGKYFKGKIGGSKRPLVLEEYWSANYFYAKQDMDR